MIIKKVRKGILNRIRKNPETSGLRYKDFGKSFDFKEYSDEEITEMFYGIYKNNKHLRVLVDGDYFIDMNNVVQTGCSLEKVSYYGKSKKDEILNFTPNSIQTVKTFYVKDYFLHTANEVKGAKRHFISRFLFKTGAIKTGRGKYTRLYTVGNQYMVLQDFKEGLFPKDLYFPIQTHINRLFFGYDYKISDFLVETEIQSED